MGGLSKWGSKHHASADGAEARRAFEGAGIAENDGTSAVVPHHHRADRRIGPGVPQLAAAERERQKQKAARRRPRSSSPTT